jgi:valyl-tRNA synthetase
MMEKQYKSDKYEKDVYSTWEKFGSFTLNPNKAKKPFCIILPPPNANADLHLGHAMYVVEDILIRYHRLKGETTLWLPGADHAGFETQYVFEKHLQKEGKSRFDFDRSTLYRMIWDFVQKNKSAMENQLRRLGFSLDWSREKFTLDPDIVKIVWQTFKKLYDDGLVYRGERLVNYCPVCGTSFSDLEIIHLDVEGKLYFIRYPFKNSKTFITVATTRPETMLGDTAVAVHPQDPRYQNVVGKTVILPIINRPIPIIADEAIDQKFGTGAVKITPAHDENDWETGNRHHLAKIQVINFEGKIQQTADNLIPKDLVGLTVTQARKKILEKLTALNLLKKVKSHKMVLAKCYKCGSTIQPLPLPQWFIKVEPLTGKAIEAVKKRQLKIIPKRFEKIYYWWLENLRDWNISRQIVWGIQIPAWFCLNCKKWVVTSGKKPQKCPYCNSTNLTQDSDTFDTWFSSGQWPFATLKTAKKDDFKYFYPTSVLDTMWDILPFWVIRMVMLGLYVTGKIPFKVVYLHSRVTDAKGQKMSKSKGNVINPIQMVDKYGADALRLALVFNTSPGKDLRMSEDKIRGFRNFSNKLWNIARFINLQFEAFNKDVPFYKQDMAGLKPEDVQLLKSLNLLIKNTTANLENYRFSPAAEELYQFVWHQLADKYIESIKQRLTNKDVTSLAVLRYVFVNCLKLLHPFTPFITEVLWSKIPRKNKDLLINSTWPIIS